VWSKGKKSGEKGAGGKGGGGVGSGRRSILVAGGTIRGREDLKSGRKTDVDGAEKHPGGLCTLNGKAGGQKG